MKFTIRLVGAIWLSVLIVIGGFAFLQIREERERLLDDLKRRAVLVGEGLKEAIEPQVARGSTVGVERILKKFGRPTRGIAVYDRFAGLMVATPEVAKLLPPSLPEVTDAVATNAVSQGFRVVGARPAYVYAAPLTQDERPVGALAVFLDAEHLQAAEWDLWWRNALRFLALALVISLIALVLVRSSVTAPMAKMSEWTKALRAGRYVPPPEVPDTNVFGPLAREVAGLARSMQRARAAAEHEAAPGVADGGGGARLLLRVRKRGALAAVPHRAHAARVPARRLGQLPRGEPPVRRDGARRDQERRGAARPDPGLPLRAAARARQGGAARCARRALLAHPLAELRSLRDLPVAAGAARRHAGRRSRRLPHAVLLQQFSGDGGSHARNTDRLGTLRGHPR